MVGLAVMGPKVGARGEAGVWAANCVCSRWLSVDHASQTPPTASCPSGRHRSRTTFVDPSMPPQQSRSDDEPWHTPHPLPTPSTPAGGTLTCPVNTPPAGQLAVDRDVPRQLHGLAGCYLTRQRVEQRRLATAAGTPTNSNWW